MKRKFYISMLALFIGIAMLSVGTYQKPKGPHGGILKEAGKYVIEFKNTGSEVYAYLLSNKLKPLGNNGVTCAARFYFSDGTCIDANLVFYEKDGFVTSSSISNFNLCRITFSVRGEKISAAFDNLEIIVLGK